MPHQTSNSESNVNTPNTFVYIPDQIYGCIDLYFMLIFNKRY